MMIILWLCLCVAATKAGIIGYPAAPVAYHNYVFGGPFTTYNTVARPLGVSFTGFNGYPVAFGPHYLSFDAVPGNVIFPGIPGVVHYLPVTPPSGKEKPSKKKPNNKKGSKDSKEETTEESKKEEEDTTKTGEEETEELAE